MCTSDGWLLRRKRTLSLETAPHGIIVKKSLVIAWECENFAMMMMVKGIIRARKSG